MMVKRGLASFIVKFYVPLNSCYCPVLKMQAERLDWSGQLAPTLKIRLEKYIYSVRKSKEPSFELPHSLSLSTTLIMDRQLLQQKYVK